METNAREIFINNLNRVMKLKNKSQSQIAKDLKIPLSTVSSWVNGQSYPRVDKMQMLADYLNVSMKVLTDHNKDEEDIKDIFSSNLKHYMITKKITKEYLANYCNVSVNKIMSWLDGDNIPTINQLQLLADCLDVKKSKLTDEVSGNYEKSGYKIPVLGRVVAGIPLTAIEEILDYEEISEQMGRYGEYFALKIKGDSMEPKFTEGDIVIVRKQETAQTGDIAIVLVNGDEATLKKIKITSSGIMLIPTNQTYDPIVYSAEEIVNKPVTIIGKVVELRAKFK